MNSRPTPETDKAFKYWPSENAELVDANFARKLERERDEAKELAQAFHNDQVTLLLERDEARAKYATEATEHMLAVNKLCNERDEARKETEYYKERYEQLKDERDEAREEVDYYREKHDLTPMSWNV